MSLPKRLNRLNRVTLVLGCLLAAPAYANPPQTAVFDREKAFEQRGDAINDACVYGQGVAYNAAFGAALVGSFEASLASYALNLGLKGCAPILYRPEDVVFNPGNNCSVTVDHEREVEYRNNILSVPTSRDQHWGAFGTPTTFHWNTATRVDFNTFGTDITTDLNDQYTVPVGNHYLQWTAETLVSPIDFVFIYIPGLPKGVEKYLGGTAGVIAAETILNIGIELGKFPLGTALNEVFDPFPSGAINIDYQKVSVLDLFAPTFSALGSQDFVFEAVDIGGTTFDSLNVATNLSNGDVLRQAFIVEDNCDGQVELIAEKGFWPLNEQSTHTWTAKDNGPNAEGERNETTFTQNITVVDTIDPIIVAPPSLAFEGNLVDGKTNISRMGMGVPQVFDLGDPDISITATGVTFFTDNFNRERVELLGGINEVIWTATDTSGNSASVTQIINVKQQGTNQLPSADANSVNAQTFDFVQIPLQGFDPDGDPLSFHLETLPQNGFFKSPLLPFFIDDFRLPKLSTDCRDRPPEQVANPSYVTTTDDKITYVLDVGTNSGCDPDNQNPLANHRVAIFDENGQYVTHRNMPRKADIFGLKVHPERNEVIYTAYDPVNEPQRPIIYRLDAQTLQTVQQYTTEDAPWSSVNAANISDDEVMYLSPGCDRVWVFDLHDAIPINPIANYLPGTSTNPGPCPDTAPPGFQLIKLCDGNNCVDDDRDVARDINFTAEGDILVSTAHRLFKIKAPKRNANGDLILSNDIRWLGRCSGGSGCDITRGASFGFTCIDGVTCSGGGSAGNGRGQFYQLSGIDVDPNGNIYTADWGQFGDGGSKGRIQRFSPDGFFAGEAKSSCPTDTRCFVLGDFSRPRAIGVNADQMFVLDEQLDLVHVFQTSVIEYNRDVSNDTAMVTYASDEGFTGTDSFTFRVRDGFESSESEPATVNINVSRNFRPPISESVTLFATEDQVRQSIMLATDPDGSLDTLSFTIIDPPSHGTLAFDGAVNGLGQPYTYTPEADFNGSDSFTFISNDGIESSNLAEVTIVVQPVNDPPTISLRESGVASRSIANNTINIARGYATDFTFRVDEIDDVDLYWVSIDLGDGSEMLYEDDITDGSIDGIALLPDLRGADLVIQHTYTEDADMEVCVTDNVVLLEGIKLPTATSTTVCEVFQINAIPMADVQVSIEGSQVVSRIQNHLTFDVVLRNRAAENNSALDANNVSTSLILDQRLNVINWQNPSGGQCNLNGDDFQCTINTLTQGSQTVIPMTVSLDHTQQAGDRYLIMVDTTADQDDPLLPNAAALDVSVAPISDIIVNTAVDESTSCALLCGEDGLSCPAVGEYMPQCSLRSALQLANGLPGEQSIGLGTQVHRVDPDVGQWYIFDDTRLLGSGVDQTVLSGMNAGRVLSVSSGNNAHISGLTIRDGFTEFSGGGLSISPGAQVTLEDVWVTGNKALSGGGIHHRGDQLMLRSVSITDNQALDGNGQNSLAGGLYLGGFAQLQNTTVSNNSSETLAAGIAVANNASAGIFNSTITENISQLTTGGVSVNSGSRLDVYMSILSGNQRATETGLSANDCQISTNGQFISFGYNVLGQWCGNGNGLDLLSTDPMLFPLGDYGGQTPTHKPRSGSVAIDIGLSNCDAAVDQRGLPRPADGDMDGHVLCDSGAVEVLVVEEIFSNGFE
ncbi:choice-of-anchor Q domain-containing protein [Marinicella sediminis]|uniref:Choice-of-anchor Q domain-containing protein n=1 Tax=Marinicella sediminis TaxID=1792834 RepID=A0ABV7J978_9GAMM|nr:Ig-like domain-containing protein [Marinicella sediminis]